MIQINTLDTVIDLTMPIEDHFRWKVERRHVEAFDRGDQFQITWIGWSVHGFTHIDVPRHISADGDSSTDLKLERLIGPAAVIDLTDAEPMQAINAAFVEERASHLRAGDIAILKTCWNRVENLNTPDFWRQSPYLDRSAAEWFLRQGVKAMAFDFPQDYPIRKLLDGVVLPMSEYVTHDVLLRQGIPLIEYVTNLDKLDSDRTRICALPLSIPNSDGVPARVVAFDQEKGDWA